MCSLVPLQLIGASEAFPAEGPGADEGPLSGVPAQVCSQVRRLPIHLLTAGNMTDVLLLLTGVTDERRPFIRD